MFNFEKKTISMVTEYSNPEVKYEAVSDHAGNISNIEKKELFIKIDMEDEEVENGFINLDVKCSKIMFYNGIKYILRMT
ncbi:hypothetical protein [Clostridium amazonitimonense]|uniref:hypothetical protein n=1 Tax=Clostridium amazonitimonense TaxID=1499689 RepID=UPI000509F25A|nr:hypothetical protein [Clostridium amazonitimonense]